MFLYRTKNQLNIQLTEPESLELSFCLVKNTVKKVYKYFSTCRNFWDKLFAEVNDCKVARKCIYRFNIKLFHL